jgi:type I restriction enzyme M protein
MLDSETKRHIDAARDVLVGKVPDPKAQVEQITTALIYKFMDDMDRDAQRLGGKPSFFVGEYEKYAWTRLLDPRMSGQERLNLYAEALTVMTQNERLPQLFRNIFKDAFLPYRDPATLSLFLKEINAFTYEHSENLGDAFEYLLSVLSSQGDAGQFRTPRHIIDFMVNVVDPQKNETMLDPACGTAGFLISAYRHILQASADHPLTPDEKDALMGNLVGYDISPDMVRLSLVNMYLHSFPNPHVYEYDTLTSEERWDDQFDILMANPPFMTPKGGIRPHKRFQIQANRSEVLFVDYIAEHLKPHGRAAVIVPEGIIFQSARAYTSLRKTLVESWGLWAVVSLPAGVFNPYSGVKTSILFLDRQVARGTDQILFAKVQSDGFDLGAQRRPIDANDLPAVQSVLQAWHAGTRQESPLVLWVAKERLAQSGDYNLTGDRYREADPIANTRWPMVKLSDVCTISGEYGSLASKAPYDGTVRYVRITDIDDTGQLKDSDMVSPSQIQPDLFLQRGDILLARSGSVGRAYLHRETVGQFQFAGYLIRYRADDSKMLPAFFFYLTRSDAWHDWIEVQSKRGTLTNINAKQFSSFLFPLPPLDVQQRIVDELDRYQRIIDGANQVIANWRPTFDIDSSWPHVPIAQVASVRSGYGFPLEYQGKTDEEIPFLKVSDMNLPGNEERIVRWNNSVSRTVLRRLKGEACPSGTVIFPKIGAAIATNKKRILTRDSTYDNNVMGIIPDTRRLLPDFLHAYLLTVDLSLWASKCQPPSVRKSTVEAHEIPLPPLATQHAIVANIKKEEEAVESCRSLISTYEAKISAKIGELWGNTQGEHLGIPTP